jgi:hypothetical protein
VSLRAVGTLTAALCLLSACADERPAPPPLPAVAQNSSTLPPPLPLCPGTGHWEACTVFDRLERAGLAPQRRDTVRHAWLRVPGQVWGVGRGSVQIFRYADSVARRIDFVALDSARARPKRDTSITWSLPVTVLVNDNLLAIVLSDNAQQIERVTLALTAGPPPKPPEPSKE